ncbi:HD domain-containing phosphohydrolase [Halarcobacter bivalviorum]|uniref:HD domain-containing phosphohydrolase n=1 Tax=Halarcobacter bivalviorum TaxID=663364 RepID=UPI001D196548|nr:HD domain-containing phosphohydrolase [Halarcobacter bivalviorum]
MKKPEFFLKIKPTISFILILLIASVIVITLSLQYYFSKDLAFNATENNFKITAEKIEQKIITFDKSNSDILTTIIHSEEMKVFPKVGENHRLLKQLTVILENKKHIYAIYAGNKEGEFFEVINLNVSEKLRAKYEVSNEVKWLIIKIYEEDGKKVKYEEYLDKDLVILKTLKKKTKYNPSIRPWFKKAFSTKNVIKTKPYKYTNFDELGITYAKKIKNSDIVLGVDVLLNSISTFLDKQTHIEDKQILIFQEDSKIIAAANLANNTKTVPYKQLIAFSKDKKIQTLNFNLKLEKEYFVYYSVIKTEFKNKDYLAILIPIDTIMKPFIDKIYNSFLITLLILTLTIPLIWYSTRVLVEPIQKLEKENEKISNRKFDDVKVIDTKIKEYHELSLSLHSMSVSIKEYELKQEELMDSFIKLIASAIDAKSKYTGGHCERVPVLTIALANAASKSQEGIFKEFNLKTKDEKRELSVAAWLHDCGKVTTPEYVVDKATKLETLYNRIHEIRTRFEVIHRDLTIKMYENILLGANKEKEEKLLKEEHKKLFEEFKIVATANIGGEFMDEKDIEKIYEISQRKWTKYFNDTLGLSQDELSRVEDKNRVFPKEENLLVNKKEHLIERKHFSQEEFEKFRFKMEVPEYLYNLGEVYNLTIKKGTLTEEERFKINEHMIMSIKMLEQLPFPKILEKVPEYAGAHHETLIGTGYPRKLVKEQMSIPARIMAVADIFEALTAADRPYKEAKTLSESIKILGFMVKDKHIDEDIFKLFLTSGVYKEYALKYLKKEQIDEVDISKYL